jgi:hypothetical protein
LIIKIFVRLASVGILFAKTLIVMIFLRHKHLNPTVMKKHSFLVLAGGLLAFAACNNPASDTGASQAQIDSMVNARVEAIRAEMTASNDSLINAMAQIKADSMLAAMKPGTSVTTTTTTRTVKNTHPAATTPKPTTIGNGKPRLGNQDPNTVGNGKPKMGDHAENKDGNTIGNGKPKMGGNK